MTNGAGDRVHNEIPDPADEAELVIYLQAYAERQLAIVMTPRLLQLRRLVIGEVSRFPALATALSESGLQRAISALATVFERQADRGLLEIGDPFLAASQFN